MILTKKKRRRHFKQKQFLRCLLIIYFTYRFDPLLHDGRPRSDETRTGGLPTGQTGPLSVRTVPGDHQVLGSRPIQAAHVRRVETRARCSPGEPRVRGQLRGPGESCRRVGQQRQGSTIIHKSHNDNTITYYNMTALYIIVIIIMAIFNGQIQNILT